MHGLIHLVFNIVSKGRVQDQDTAPGEQYHTHIKQIFQFTQRQFDADKTMAQMLKVGFERMIGRRVLVMSVCYLINSSVLTFTLTE